MAQRSRSRGFRGRGSRASIATRPPQCFGAFLPSTWSRTGRASGARIRPVEGLDHRLAGAWRRPIPIRIISFTGSAISAVVIDAIRLLHVEERARRASDRRTFRTSCELQSRRCACSMDASSLKAPQLARQVSSRASSSICAMIPSSRACSGDACLRRHARQSQRHDGYLQVGPAAARWPAAARDRRPRAGFAMSRCPTALARGSIGDLARADLAFTHAHWREPSFDIWEEEQGEHYYTLCVAEAALREGAEWLHAAGNHERPAPIASRRG